jgi:hypothetical protein
VIALVFAQLAARWEQAVALLALSMAATVAAVGVPVYTATIDRTATQNELAAADASERLVSMPVLVGAADEEPAALDTLAIARSGLTSFEPVTTVQIRVQGLRAEAPATEAHRVVARDGFCGRAVFQAGRCPVGTREVALPAALAEQTGHTAGDELLLAPVVTTDRGYLPDGPQVALTLVGVFEPRDPADPYWLAALDPIGNRGQPAIFTSRGALASVEHTQEIVYVDAVLPADRLTPEAIPQLRAQLTRVEQLIRSEDPSAQGFNTDLTRLLDRITGHHEQARALLPIAAAPLLALCWFVVYLAVGHGIAARRREVGVVALRGATVRTRLAAVGTEYLLPMLAGALLGLAVLGGPGSGAGVLRSAGVAVAGTLAAAVLALRRELAAPVVQLLRRVPPRQRAATVAAEVLAAAVAAVVVVELRGLDGELVGVMVAGPAVVMLAVALLAARAVRPASDQVGRWALRRGWLAPAMAALSLARRPGAARLLVVLALVLGMIGYAVTSADVAAAGRATEAERAFGAARVLTIEAAERGELLQAVRAADPDGRYAMAVVSAPSRPDDPPVVAVDATRLELVARWSDHYGAGVAEVAELLRPPAAEPVMVADGELAVDLTLGEPLTTEGTTTVTLRLSPPAGPPVAAVFGPLTSDQQTYRAQVTGCGDGCRLAGLSAATTDPGSEDWSGVPRTRIEAILHELRLDGEPVGPAGWLADEGRWRTPERGALTGQLAAEVVSSGLEVSRPDAEPGVDYPLLAVDVPYPLPVAVAGRLPDGELLTSIDNQLIRVVPGLPLAGVPGAGPAGVLMDLEYADRLAIEPGEALEPQVWLTEDAPPTVVDRLRDEGLVILGEQTLAEVRATGDDSGAALALRFFLAAAGLAVLVGLGALVLVVAIDRADWRATVRQLRAQGMAERTTTLAGLWSYGGIVVAAVIAGVFAAGAAWIATGERMPLGVEPTALVYWPQWSFLLAAWGVAVVLLLVAAAAGAWWQRGSGRGAQEVGG